MAYLMLHLAVANKIFEKYPGIENQNAFLIGSNAPDAIGFRPDKRYEKALPHFCVGDEGWGYFTNYGEWFDNIIFMTSKLYGSVNKDFLFGYMSHVIADMENAKRFWNPVRLTNDENKKQTFFNDCYEIDSILLKLLNSLNSLSNLSKTENIDELWARLDNRESNYCLPGICEADDINYMFDVMKSQIYFDRKPNPEYKTSIFTLPIALNYIDEIAVKTIEAIKMIEMIKITGELKNKC